MELGMFRDDLPSIANYKTSFRRKQPKDTCVHTKKTLEKWQYSTEYNPSRVSTGICTYSEKTVVFGCLFEPLFNFQEMLLNDMHLYIINGVHCTSSLSIYTNGRRARCFYIYISTAVRFFFHGTVLFPPFSSFPGLPLYRNILAPAIQHLEKYFCSYTTASCFSCAIASLRSALAYFLFRKKNYANTRVPHTIPVLQTCDATLFRTLLPETEWNASPILPNTVLGLASFIKGLE